MVRDPFEALETYGADAIRWYFYMSHFLFFYIGFFKIQFTGMVGADDFLSRNAAPDGFLLKDQAFGENGGSVIVQHHMQTEQITVELFGSFQAADNENLVNLLKAIYLYNQAANEFFGK